MSKSLNLRIKALEQAKEPDDTGVLAVPPGMTAEEAQELVFTSAGPRRPKLLIMVFNSLTTCAWTDNDTALLREGAPEIKSRIFWTVVSR